VRILLDKISCAMPAQVSGLEQCLMQSYPALSGLVEVLDMRELHLLSLTSKTLKSLVLSFLCRAQDVNTRLNEFVNDAMSFRAMMRDTRAVLSGQFAMNFFLGSCMSCSLELILVDPDFYSGVKVSRWVKYLRKREGYKSVTASGTVWQRATQVGREPCWFADANGLISDLRVCKRIAGR
jgi:hypothetical protein